MEPALALCLPAGACVDVRIAFRACFLCMIFCHLGKYPAFPGPNRMGLEKERLELLLCFLLGCLPSVLAAWCVCSWRWVRAFGAVRDARGIVAGLFGSVAWVKSFAGCHGKAQKFYRKFPWKIPKENFFKKFPLWGKGLLTKKFCKKGLTYCCPYAIVKPRKSDKARRKPLRKEVRTWTK